MSITRNHLSLSQQLQLIDWLKTNQADLQGKSRSKISGLASGALGFAISNSSINTCLSASGIEIKPSRLRKPKAPAEGSDAAIVAAELVELITKLGNKPSNRLLSIAAKAPSIF